LLAAFGRVAAVPGATVAAATAAAELFISENTVESHLKQIYAKLGISSRTELGRHFSPR